MGRNREPEHAGEISARPSVVLRRVPERGLRRARPGRARLLEAVVLGLFRASRGGHRHAAPRDPPRVGPHHLDRAPAARAEDGLMLQSCVFWRI